MHEPDIWPLPHRPWLRRVSSRTGAWLAYAVVFATLVATASAGPGMDAPHPSLRKRVRRLRDGGRDSFVVRIIGSSSWCPTLPDETTIRLGWRSAVSTLGRDRIIPVEDLTPVAVHRPRTKPGLPRLPRRSWVLDLDGAGGPGSIAAPLEDLALLGAAAGWPPPPGLAEHSRAAR